MSDLSLSFDRALTLALVAVFVFLVAYLMVFPLRVIDYQDEQMPVGRLVDGQVERPSSLSPGDDLPIVVRYCKHANLPARLTGLLLAQDSSRAVTSLTDERGQTMVNRDLPEGCRSVTWDAWRLPDNLRPGCYVARLSTTFTPNAFRTITKHSHTERFCVQKEDI